VLANLQVQVIHMKVDKIAKWQKTHLGRWIEYYIHSLVELLETLYSAAVVSLVPLDKDVIALP
jgi:hypothetical protein